MAVTTHTISMDYEKVQQIKIHLHNEGVKPTVQNVVDYAIEQTSKQLKTK